VTLGAKLKGLRETSQESLQDVANAIGVSKAYVWQLEQGGGTNPSVEVLKAIANHYKTTVSALIGESLELSQDQQIMRMFRSIEELPSSDRNILEDLIASMKKRRSSADE
jgi:transcriptional regulator with XRE-family HTH domain